MEDGTPFQLFQISTSKSNKCKFCTLAGTEHIYFGSASVSALVRQKLITVLFFFLSSKKCITNEPRHFTLNSCCTHANEKGNLASAEHKCSKESLVTEVRRLEDGCTKAWPPQKNNYTALKEPKLSSQKPNCTSN